MKSLFFMFGTYVLFGSAFFFALNSSLEKSQAIHCSNGIARACQVQKTSY